MARRRNIVEIAERFGNERAIRVFKQRKFKNRKKAEERKTGQKSFGFTAGGGADMGSKKKKKKSPGPKGYIMGESYGNRKKRAEEFWFYYWC